MILQEKLEEIVGKHAHFFDEMDDQQAVGQFMCACLEEIAKCKGTYSDYENIMQAVNESFNLNVNCLYCRADREFEDVFVQWYPKDCERVEEVYVMDDVTDIYELTFSDMKRLTKLHLPYSIQTIGESAFDGCTELDIDLKHYSSLQSLPTRTFSRTGIRDLTLPDSIKTIGGGCFLSCHRLVKVDLGHGLEKIGDRCFQFCDNLQEVRIPKSVKEIGQRVFIKCDRLRKIYLPQEVRDRISDDIFNSLTSDKSIIQII